MLHIAGITMPVPEGWSVRALPRLASGTSLCLTPPNPTMSTADPAHPACAGITLAVADTARDGTASTLPFAGAGSCPAGRPHTLTYDDQDITVGGRRADLFTSSCGATPLGEYWQLTDESLSISAVCRWRSQAQVLADDIDLTAWAHKPGPPTPATTPANTAPGA